MKHLTIFLISYVTLTITYAQQISFSVNEIGEGDCTVVFDLTNNQVTATKSNGQTLFSHHLGQKKYDQSSDVIGFSFSDNTSPVVQYNERSDLLIISNKNHNIKYQKNNSPYLFTAKNNASFSSTFVHLQNAINNNIVALGTSNVSAAKIYKSCPDSNHPHMIDLGLSSGTKWACCNVGASKPEDYGNYYAWGETETKTTYNESTYKYYQNGEYVSIGSDIAGTSYDVAHVKWGGSWNIPSFDQIEELLVNCTSEWTTVNGVSGRRFKGKNGGSIFLPAAGCRWNDGLDDDRNQGNYWSSTHGTYKLFFAYGFLFYSEDAILNSCNCTSGHTVRPVTKSPTTYSPPTDNDVVSSSSDSSKTFTINGVTFKMIYIQGGTFTMGATSDQGSDAYSDEKPTHKVTLSNYYIGETEVSQQLWQAVMGSNPSYYKNYRKPVEQVSYNDCIIFISKLNSITGQNFRLPTEAEWEYAARGGKKSRGYKYSGGNKLGNVAWYRDNSGSLTHEVATKSPNELGIYDMSGNVSEWCNDWFGNYSSSSKSNPQGSSSGTFHICRGGDWLNNARSCRVSNRGHHEPTYRNGILGFRLAL